MTTRKKILFLAPHVPFPPDKGERIRTFHLLDRLAQSHEVYCACLARSPAELRHADALRRWCAATIVTPWRRGRAALRGLAAFAGGRSATCAAFDDGELKRRITELARRVRLDAVVAFSSATASAALAVEADRRVLDLCDVDSEKWLDYATPKRPTSPLFRAEGRRLRKLELECLARFDAMLVISDRERRMLDPLGRHPRLHVIPNGVHLPNEEPPRAETCDATIGFVGEMSYRPNVAAVLWFAREVWPRVLDEIPTARFLIVGRNPAGSVRALGALRGVTVTGSVPDVRPWLDQMRVVVAPLPIVRGLPNKVLEALAHRRPVVATPAVAEALGLRGGHDLLVADAPLPFADRVTALCRYDALCRHVADTGRLTALARFSWSDALADFERIALGQHEPAKPSTPPVPVAA